MTTQATADSVAELRRLAEAATPGPWEVLEEDCGCGGDYPCSHGTFPTYLVAPKKRVVRHSGSPFEREQAAELASFLEGQDVTQEDAAYIAAVSPDVLLRLLDDRDRLRAALDGVAGAWRAYEDDPRSLTPVNNAIARALLADSSPQPIAEEES